MKLKLVLALAAFFLIIGASRLPGQTITDFSPTVGAAGDTITINGSGFTLSDKVYLFNGKLASAAITSDSQLTATAPSGTTTGPIGIRVGTGTTTCGSGGFNCSPGDFTVVGTGPYITSVSPNLGAVGDSVTIY